MTNFNKEYITMPWEDPTTIIYTEPSGEQIALKRWEVVVKQLSAHFKEVDDLVEAIRRYSVEFNSDGTQVTPAWSFKVFRETFNSMDEKQLEEFFKENGVLSSIKSLVLRTPDICPKILWMGQHKEKNFKLHQMQIACILANSFFCTFPARCSNQPSINFNRLFEGSKAGPSCRAREKLKCIIHYFFRICQKQPCGYLSFHRRVIEQHNYPRWNSTTVPLTGLTTDTDGRIEDQPDHLQMDFANRVLGGGVLGWGCVQEEIRFVICPELIASRLFIERMEENEAVLIIGAERYCNYKGYANNFTFDGNHDDVTPFDSEQRRQTHILAVDALRFTKPQEQYRESRILREVKKLYTGVRPMSLDCQILPLATGNWGCGAYRGDVQLKSLIQIMAASQAGRDVAYFTFGDEDLKKNLKRIHTLLLEHAVTVGLLYRTLANYLKCRSNGQSVFQFVADSILMRKRNDLFTFLNPDEVAAMEGGQKKRKMSGPPNSGAGKHQGRITTSPRTWTEREKKETDAELSQKLSQSLTTQAKNGGKEVLDFPLSPSMFSDSDEVLTSPTPSSSKKQVKSQCSEQELSDMNLASIFDIMDGLTDDTSTSKPSTTEQNCIVKPSCDNFETSRPRPSLNPVAPNVSTQPQEIQILDHSSEQKKRYSQSRIDSYFKK